jgi:hypothetical protein
MFVKRHQIPKTDGVPFTPRDLWVGGMATMYGRTFYIVAVDGFTRTFLEQQGITVGADLPYPQTPFDAKQSSLKSADGVVL